MATQNSLAENFRQRVRIRMDSLGMSQGDLAKRLKVTQPHVWQLLTGHRDPGLTSLAAFAKALEVEPADLLRDVPHRKNGKSS